MIGLLVLSAALASPPGGPASKPPLTTQDEFSAWFKAASQGQLSIPAKVGRVATGCRYILIDGLDIGITQGSFGQNIKELRAIGVPRESIHLVEPSPRKTVSENRGEMHARLLEIAKQGPEPLVIIAHSRGACDALAFALSNPEFVSERVRAIFLIQGPFGGSGAADFVSGEGSPLDHRMPPVYRLGARVIGGLETRFLNGEKHDVVTSLSRESSARFWDRLLEAHPEALPVVSPKIFYVTSRTRPSRHPLLQRVPAWYVHTYYGPNDGLIMLDDQSIPGVGTVVAVLDAGHTDLTHRFPSARPHKKLRQALVDAMVMTVGKSPRPADIDLDTLPAAYDEPSPAPKKSAAVGARRTPRS